MKRFLIEITDNDSLVSDLEDREQISKEDYLDIIRTLKEAELFGDILKDIPVICDKCNSFILPIKTLYHVIEKYNHVTDNSWVLDGIEQKVMGVVRLSLEEWIKYSTEGIKGIDFVHSTNGESVTDSEGNPYKFLWEECAVILDPECGCKSVMSGY
jgi:hypothetical protein